MTRRDLLSSTATSAAALLAPHDEDKIKRPRRRPNFLFVLADDHAGYALGSDGNSRAETPNLDRLASEGMRFSSHYCNSPVCTPSRQGLLSGRLPHATGVTRLATKLPPETPTLARQFQKAGYRTAVLGKMHFNQPGRSGLHGFDYLLTEAELQRAWLEDVKPSSLATGTTVKPPWKPFEDPARIWLNAEGLPFGRTEEEMKGTYLARRAAEYLSLVGDSPFALWVSFQEPHSPYDFPIEDRTRWAARRRPAPRVGPGDAGQIPNIFRSLSEEDKQGIAASYYTSVNFLDRNVGRVLDALERNGHADNTLVVYSADHGYCLGEHGRFEKHCGYEPALRVPWIARWPGHVKKGVHTGFTEHVDLAPTVADLLNLEPIPGAEGHSLKPALEGKKLPHSRRLVFSEYLENEEAYIRTPEWKFIFCTGQRERTDGYVTDNPKPGRYRRLFNLKSDPGEFEDVSAKHPAVVDKLETAMLERFRKTHPDRAKEPQRLSRAESLEFYLRPRDA